MSKVRVVVIDAEGDAGTVLAAIQGFLGMSPEPAPARVAQPAAPAPAIAPALPAPQAPREVKRAKAAPRKAANAEAPKAAPAKTEAPVPESGGVRGEVYAALKPGPMTSLELVGKFEKRCSAGAIYLALKELRNAGVVESRENESGVKMNYRIA